MGTSSNGEDPDTAAFHQGLRCLLKQNRSLEKEIQPVVPKYT